MHVYSFKVFFKLNHNIVYRLYTSIIHFDIYTLYNRPQATDNIVILKQIIKINILLFIFLHTYM